MNKKIFTSESVTEGHPDKICDQISDAVLDAVLAQDPFAHVACECAITTGMVLIMGEISSSCHVNYADIARQVITEIGYTSSQIGFDGNTCSVITALDKQSSDIAMGVNDAMECRNSLLHETGAGDQGMVFGYACDETDELMPFPILYAHKLCAQMTKLRKDGTLPYLRPDGKSQISVEYEEDQVKRIDCIVISSQHSSDISCEKLKADITNLVIKKIIPAELMDEQTKILINPTGRFVIGGPQGDSGLTGRKIIADTYGGMARHGGGAFSGKDPTKVDRSAAYAARWIAKNLVAAKLAKKCEIQIAYAIGVANPVSVSINTYHTSQLTEEQLLQIISEVFDLRPSAMIKELDLKRPIYQKTAAYGHFGRKDPDFTWERTDKIQELLEAAKKFS